MAGETKGWAPFTGKFILVIDGEEIGQFTEVSGLNVSVGVEKVEEGGQNHFSHQFPGRLEWPNIMLKRGVTDSDELFAWFKKTSGDYSKAELTRTCGAITVVNDKGEPVRAWNMVGAFPVKWTGPQFAASSSDIATEELEIAHHGFDSEDF